MAIDPQLCSAYQRDGVAVLRNLVSADTLESLRQGVADNMAHPGPWANEYTPAGSTGRFFDDYVNWNRIAPFAEVGMRGSVPEAALGLMDTQIARLFH